jgi:ribonuclease HI
MKQEAIEVFTDGSCSVKDVSGGWAFVAKAGQRQENKYGHASETTVNKMELLAIQRALEFVSLNNTPLEIYTDSEYARKCLSLWHVKWTANGWVTANGVDVKNSEEIQDCLELLLAHRKYRKVTIHWVRGHSGHISNELADKLAHRARVEKITNWL